MTISRCHNDVVIAMMRGDPEFAAEYLKAAFEEIDEDSGEAAFLMALHHVVEAGGSMAEMAPKIGLSRKSLQAVDMELVTRIKALVGDLEVDLDAPLSADDE